MPTLDANGRVLAGRPGARQLDVPSADNTQMDGYAVRAADCASGAARLPVSQRIPAGHVGQPLQPGTAARIFTGALIPAGRRRGGDAGSSAESRRRRDGARSTMRRRPANGYAAPARTSAPAAVILAAGTRLRSQELGLAASVGLATLPVLRRLRVAVFFTGDELAMPGEPLAPGAIYNSNRLPAARLLENLGCDITDFGIVPDTPAGHPRHLAQGGRRA